jgi:phosphoribosylamine-glycine ligase
MAREEFGRAAGRNVVIEKRLEGQELSILALVAGRTILTLAPTQDHKALLDNAPGCSLFTPTKARAGTGKSAIWRTLRANFTG